MARHFTRPEAERLLPQVEEAIRDAIVLKTEYESAEEEMESFARRIAMAGGSLVNRDQMLAQRGRRDAVAGRLRDALEEIQAFGCLVKDLDIGLIDFPTLYKGEEVYLCWKLGEPRILFWHGIHEGFRGRKPVDEDFLTHHQGDLPN